ncbi:MAG: hypothetical protein JXB40_02425 [Candidatus Omnitrophica bacterium]|nr:hypothetical protein [Candidatus Omnitrophota bacterium]
MKKLLVVIAVILVIAIAAVAVFIATFNAESYKTALISRLEAATGNKVEIGSLSLRWNGAILLGVEGFRMSSGADTVVSFDRATATLEPASLLSGALKIPSLTIINPGNKLIKAAEVKDGIVQVRDIFFKNSGVNVGSFSARMASGSLSGSMEIKDLLAVPRTALRFIIEVEGIKSFVLAVFGKNQAMDGNARFTFDGTMSGKTWPEISKTLTGKGEFYLDRGVMVDTNVLRQSLSALTIFPGLPEEVKEYVPAPIRQSLGDNDTLIKPLRQPYTIEGGYVILPGVNLATDAFDLRGNAKSSLTGDISGKGVIRFAGSVSAAMIKAVPEMRYITDSEGLVEVPMAFKGGQDNFKVIPDLKYVGSKVAVQKAREIVASYLKQVTQDRSQDAPAGGTAPQPEKPPKLKDLMNGLLEKTNGDAR